MSKSKKSPAQITLKPTNFALLLIMTITLSVIAVGGISYAIFTSNQKGTENTVTVGTLTTTFTESNVITMANTYPMTDASGQTLTPYKFIVKNTGSLPVTYQVYLEIGTGNTLPTNKIKYSIQKDTAAFSTPALLSTLTNNRFVTGQKLAAGASVTYNLRMWVDNAAGNEVQGQTYKAKVVVDSAQS